MDWRLAILILAAYAAQVLANTEQIRFKFDIPKAQVPPYSDGTTQLALAPTSNHNNLTHTIAPSHYHDTPTTWFKIDAVVGSTYEVRVCWPASHPAAFDLLYDGDTGFVGVKYASDYYSHINHLMNVPKPVPFHVILNEVVLDAIPSDIVSTVVLIIAGLAVALPLSTIPLKCL